MKKIADTIGMKSSTKYRIFLFLCLVLSLSLVFAVYQLRVCKEEPKKEATRLEQAPKEESYLLKESNGQVVIYRGDGKTVYDKTAIAVDRLPRKIQEKIKKGYYIPDYRQLIDFLENYSS